MLRDLATGPVQFEAVQAAGRLLNVTLTVIEVRAIGEMQSAFDAAAAE